MEDDVFQKISQMATLGHAHLIFKQILFTAKDIFTCISQRLHFNRRFAAAQWRWDPVFWGSNWVSERNNICGRDFESENEPELYLNENLKKFISTSPRSEREANLLGESIEVLQLIIDVSVCRKESVLLILHCKFWTHYEEDVTVNFSFIFRLNFKF